MSFTLDIRSFCEKAKKNPETVMRQVSLELFSAIIKESPVDTGHFKLNWQASGPIPATGIIAGVDLTGAKAINSATTFVTKNSYWQEFTLSNNLPYANVIEYGGYPGDGPNTTGGFSRQAPQGVVGINVKRFQSLLDQEAAKVK